MFTTAPLTMKFCPQLWIYQLKNLLVAAISISQSQLCKLTFQIPQMMLHIQIPQDDATQTDLSNSTDDATQTDLLNSTDDATQTDLSNSTDDATQTDLSNATDDATQVDHSNSTGDATQTDLCDLQLQVQNFKTTNFLSRQLKSYIAPFSEEYFTTDEHVKFYTGLPNLYILRSVFQHVISLDGSGRLQFCKLSLFQEFSAVLVKLRMDCPIQDLAYRLDVSVATMSHMFTKWLALLDNGLKPLIIWPDHEALRLTMPLSFRESFGHNVAVIIDCFEVFIQRPTNLKARAFTWSNYKHQTTQLYNKISIIYFHHFLIKIYSILFMLISHEVCLLLNENISG